MSTTASRALTAVNERQIVDSFRAASAVNQKSARSLRALNINDSKLLRELVTTTIVRRVGPRSYFLDEQKWGRRRQVGKRTVIRVGIGLSLAVAGALYFFR